MRAGGGRGGPGANGGEARRQERAGRGWEFVSPGANAMGLRAVRPFALLGVSICSAKRLPSGFLCLYKGAKAHEGGRERGGEAKPLGGSWVSSTGSRNSAPRPAPGGIGKRRASSLSTELGRASATPVPPPTGAGTQREPKREAAGGRVGSAVSAQQRSGGIRDVPSLRSSCVWQGWSLLGFKDHEGGGSHFRTC